MSPRVIDTREYRWIGTIRSAIPEGDISERIHGDTSQPTVNTIAQTGRVGALLEYHRAAVWATQLVPANASHFAVWTCASRDRLIGHKRLVAAKIAIGKPK